MKTNHTISQLQSVKSNSLKTNIFLKICFIVLLALLGNNGWGQQVIGEFPNQDGGFEDQTAGALGTTSSSTLWWLSAASITGTVSSTGGRSGPSKVNIYMTGSTHRTLRGPAAANIAAGTNYTIQFFHKGDQNADGTADYGDIRGGVSGNTYQYTAYSTNQNNASWTKYAIITGTNPGASAAGFAVVSIIEIAGKVSDFDIDDVVIYAGAVDNAVPTDPGVVTVNNATTSSLDVSWVAAASVDGGGYIVVRYTSSPNADNDPNQNGIYEVGNTHTNGTGSLTGTIRYIGTSLSFTDNVGLSSSTQYWYKVYTVDKAFNYSGESSGNGTTTGGGTPSVAFSATHPASSNIGASSTDQLIGSISLATTVADATLTGVTVTTAGTYAIGDIATNGFKFWINSSNSLSGATQLGSSQAAVASGNTVVVSGLSTTLTNGTTKYLLFSASTSATATPGNTISITTTAHANVTLSSGNKTGTDPVAVANTQTICAIQVSGSLAQDGFYSSLTNASGAFLAINGANQATKNIIIKVLGNSSAELGTNTLSGAGGMWTSLNIYPSGGVVRTISGSIAGTLLKMNGADNVTIDGRTDQAGGGDQLIFENSDNGTSAYTVLFYADATSNTIKYCTIKGSGTSTGKGTIAFTLATTGNNGNVIDYCLITCSGVNFPSNSIFSSGSATNLNYGINISNNRIVDFSGNGIYLSADSDTWTISGNSFYQSTSITPAADMHMVYLNSGATHSITGNYFGGQAASCAGSAYTVSSSAYTLFCIYAANVTGGTITITGNTFKNINLTTTGSYGFNGIKIKSTVTSACAIGTTANHNVFGVTSGTGSIVTAINNAAISYNYAISLESTGSGQTIDYNDFGGFDFSGTSTDLRVYFVYSDVGAGSATANNNTIGNTTAQNITSTAAGRFYGIYAIGSNANSMTYNTIQNIYWSNAGVGRFYGIFYSSSAAPTTNVTNNTIGSATANNIETAADGQIYPIYYSTSGTGAGSINTNTIQNLKITGTGINNEFSGIYITADGVSAYSNTVTTITSTTTKNSSPAMHGIYISASSVGNYYSNTITNLSLTENTSNQATKVYGILNTASGANIYKNTITGLSNLSTHASAAVYGIGNNYLSTTAATIYNNYITCNNGGNANSPVIGGIYVGSSNNSANIYHNTIKIYGTATSGSSNSYAFISSLASNTYTQNVKNNVFQNVRVNSGATGKHYAEAFSVSLGIKNTDFNYLEVDASQVNNIAMWNGGDNAYATYLTNSGATNDATGTVTINANGVLNAADLLVVGTSTVTSATTGVTTDILAVSRDASTPTKGCYEAPVPEIVLADNGTQVTAANVQVGTVGHVLHKFSLAVTVANTTLTGMTCTTAGTYLDADITNLKVRYSTDATLDGGDATLSTITSIGIAGAKTFTSFSSQAISTASTGYIFITANIAGGATVDNTISINAIATTDLTFSKGNKSGSTTAGGAQTFKPIACATDLIISEYVEGASNNKAIEIYNGTGSDVDLANYSLKKQVNGAGAFGNELILSGTLVYGDVYVIVYSSAQASLLALADLSTASACMSFNGNDAVALYNTGVQIDMVGVENQVSPDWGANVTLVRKSTITDGNTVYSASDWDSYASDTYTYLQAHTMTCCTPPTTQASATNTNTPTTDGFSISWTAGDGNGTMIVVRPTAQSNTTPTSGTSYTANLAWGSAGQIDANNRVVFKNTGTTAGPVTGLTSETQYTITAYEYTTTGDCYNTTSPISTNRYTLSTEPTAQPGSGLSSTTCTANTIDLTIPAPSSGADGYIVLQKAGSAPTGLPTDGNSYNVSDAIGDATVAASVTSSGTIVISGLSASTNYYFIIVPYNANASSTAQTFNYYTGGTLLQTNFSTLATGASSASTVETDATYSYTQNIAYASYQTTPVPAAAGSSVGVHNIIIKDGGGASDADAFETILTDISYTYTGTASTIRAAALFTTSGSKVAEATSVGANSITFTGLSGANVTAADNSNTELILRVTFTATVTDNEKLVFTVSSVTDGSNCSYSQFANADGGGAISDNGANDKNKIEVTADRLVFIQQPSNTSINTAMSPNPTVSAVDVNGNIDKDFSTAISATSSGTMTGSPVSGTWSNGVATFSSLTHTAAGTGYTLTATTSGLAVDNDVVSNTFDITEIVYVSGDYRSNTGTGLTWNDANDWQKHDGASWGSFGADGTPSSTRRVYIQGEMSTNGSITCKEAIVLDGGTLIITASSTINDLLQIKDNGIVNMNAFLTIDGDAINGNVFEIEDGGTFNFSYTGSSDKTTGLWNGTEKFHANSDFIVLDNENIAGHYLLEGISVVSAYADPVSGTTGCFGNLIIDMSVTASTAAFHLFPTNFNSDLTHNDLIYRSSGSSANYNTRFCAGSYTTQIGGDLIIEASFLRSVSLLNVAGTANVTVIGDILHQGTSAFKLCGPGSDLAATVNLTVEGNINVSSTGNFEFSSSSGPFTAQTITLNLQGDITIASGAMLRNVNTGENHQLNFTGIGDGTTAALTQTINIASTGATRNQYIEFNVTDNSYVQLAGTVGLELGQNSKFNVKDGGVFDFGFNGTTALNITEVAAVTNTGFDSDQGSTLKITSPDGLHDGTTLTIGNIQQVTVSDRTIDQTATFWYIGKANQVTGNSLSNASTAKIVIVELLNNTIELSLSNCLAVSDGTTLSATGGKLDIRKGIVRETATEYFSSCTGTLYMTDGKYIVLLNSADATTDNQIPRMKGLTYTYSLTGGTVELAGTNTGTTNQYLRGGRDYYSLTFSGGANKWLSSACTNVGDNTTINTGLVTIKDASTVFDAQDNTFSGNAALTMIDASLFKMSKLNETLPELLGTYTMTGGTVELYGTSSAQTHSIRGTDGSSATITYNNVELNAGSTNVGADAANVVVQAGFNVNGTMNVNSPSCFKVGSGFTIGGTGTFEVKAGATLKYGSANGITTTPTASGNIQTTTRTFLTTASYGFCGGVDQASGNALPATLENLYVDKTSSVTKVTLTNSVRANTLLNMYQGNIVTGANRVELGVSTAQLGTLTYTAGYIVGNMRRWFTNATNSGATGLFPIGEDVSGTLKNRKYLIEFTGAPTSGGYLDVSFNPVDMGLAGIPITGIAGCVTFDVVNVENQGYWIATPEATKLGDGAYTLALTGERFTSITTLCQLTLLKRVGAGNWTAPGTHIEPSGTTGVPVISRSGITGFSNFGFGGGAPNSLPVKLLSFEAKYNNISNNVDLTWKTASETNNNHFIVEKSNDAESFNELKKVNGAGNTNSIHKYNFTDENPLDGISYYRLKQVDFNGKFSYSNVISINRDVLNCLSFSDFVSEKGIISFTVNNPEQLSFQLKIVDVLGKTIYSKENNMQSEIVHISISDIKLNYGIYYFMISNNSQTISNKFFVK